MKRDMDPCRRILLELEVNPEATGFDTVPLNIEDRDPGDVSYHVMLLKEAGLLDAIEATNSVTGFAWRPTRLTYMGHEFIEASRKDSLWQKAKSIALEKTGGLSLDVLKALLGRLAIDAAFGVGGS